MRLSSMIVKLAFEDGERVRVSFPGGPTLPATFKDINMETNRVKVIMDPCVLLPFGGPLWVAPRAISSEEDE